MLNIPFLKLLVHHWLIKCLLKPVVNWFCTSFVDLLCHHLADTMPLLQHLNQMGQRLVISRVQQLTRRQRWKAFHELIQGRVIYDMNTEVRMGKIVFNL